MAKKPKKWHLEFDFMREIWSGRPGSNRRRPAWEFSIEIDTFNFLTDPQNDASAATPKSASPAFLPLRSMGRYFVPSFSSVGGFCYPCCIQYCFKLIICDFPIRSTAVWDICEPADEKSARERILYGVCFPTKTPEKADVRG